MAEKTKEELSEEIKLLQKRITELEKLYTETWQQHQFTRRYETVVRDSNDSIIIHDLEGRITAWNRGAEKMYGYKEKEALGMNIERLTPPEKAVEHKELTDHLLAGEIIDSLETQRVAKDGSILDVWMTVTKIIEYPQDSIVSTDRDLTKPVGIALIERNITERKKAEERNRRLAAIIESAGDAIIGKSLDGVIVSWNRGAEAMYGYTAKEAIGENIALLIPPECLVEFRGILLKIARGEIIERYETRRLRRDGKEIAISLTISPIKSEAGIIMGASSVARDITELKDAEEALGISEKKFKNIFDSIADGITIIDLQSKKFADVNKSICRMLGYSLKEFKALGVEDIHPKKELTHILDQIEKQSNDVLVPAADLPILRKDGSIFYASVLGTKLSLEGKKYLVGIFRDITERRNLEEVAQKRMRDLETFYQSAIGREERIIELKKEVEELKSKPEQ